MTLEKAGYVGFFLSQMQQKPSRGLSEKPVEQFLTGFPSSSDLMCVSLNQTRSSGGLPNHSQQLVSCSTPGSQEGHI